MSQRRPHRIGMYYHVIMDGRIGEADEPNIDVAHDVFCSACPCAFSRTAASTSTRTTIILTSNDNIGRTCQSSHIDIVGRERHSLAVALIEQTGVVGLVPSERGRRRRQNKRGSG